MIASLRGTLSEVGSGWCVIEAGGVGYLVQVSSHTAQDLPPRGQDLYLRTRQVVREDALQLFGFGSADERDMFVHLLSVNGVGPKVALAIAVLSGMRPHALARAIRDEQVGALVTIPGVGRKTAERLVVELRDKIEVPAGAAREGVLPRAERYDDAVAALTGLGYTPAQAQEAVRKVAGSDDDPSLEHLVRRALALLGKSAVASR